MPQGLRPINLQGVGTNGHTFWGRAYGLEGRIEWEDDGTLSVYGSEEYGDHYTLLAQGSVAWIGP